MVKNIVCPIKKQHDNREFLSFDVETSGELNTFVCGSVYSKEGVFFTKSKTELKNFLLSYKNFGKYIYSTNLQFDFFALFELHELNPFKFKLIFQNSNLIAVIYKYNEKNRIVFLDTINYFKMGVEKLGEYIGLKKLKKPLFLGRKPKNRLEWLVLKKYNIRDAEISYKSVEKLQELAKKLGFTLKFTIGSCALDLFRKNFLEKPYLSLKNPEYIQMFENAYFGGRTEAFARGFIKNYFFYDINSLYPYVMLNEFPDTFSFKFISHGNLINLEYKGLSEIEGEQPYIFYPVLPMRAKNKVIYPYGKIKGVYTNDEIKLFLEKGGKITKIKRQLIFTKTFKPFEKYVKFLYNARITDKENEFIYKSLLNSLYGKFFQKPSPDISYMEIVEYEQNKAVYNGYKITVTPHDKIIAEKASNKYPFWISPIWSVYCTSYARIYLYSFLEKYKAIYCDTDSIITKEKINTSNKLGDLKLVCHIKKGIIFRPKLYFINNEIVKFRGVKNPSKNHITQLINGDNIKIEKIIKFKESLRLLNSVKPNQKTTVFKNFDVEDQKRKWKEKFNPRHFQLSRPLLNP